MRYCLQTERALWSYSSLALLVQTPSIRPLPLPLIHLTLGEQSKQIHPSNFPIPCHILQLFWRHPRRSHDTREIFPAGMPRGFLPVRHVWNTLSRKRPEGNLIKCLNYRNWLLGEFTLSPSWVTELLNLSLRASLKRELVSSTCICHLICGNVDWPVKLII